MPAAPARAKIGAVEPAHRTFPYSAGQLMAGDGYLLVRDRSIPDLGMARVALEQLDQALVSSGVRGIIFDTREMTPPSPEVNELYWNWVTAGKNHDRVAILVESEMRRIEGNMKALSKRVKLRSFHELEAAQKWLQASSR